MLAYIVRRLVTGIFVLFFASILVFVLVAESGDPLAVLRSRPNTPPAVIHAREVILHLNLPIYERYWIWFSHVVRGDFGTTIAGQPVGPQLWTHLAVTLRMVIVATILAVVLAVAVGVFSAIRKGKPSDHIFTTTNFLFLAIPTFVLGILLKEFVAIPINQHVGKTVLYTIGQQNPILSGPWLGRLPDYAAHTVLPVVTLMLVSYSSWAIYQRASMLEVLDSDYVRLARSKGLSRRRVLIRHILRNALIPVVTVVAIDFAAVFGGAIITEDIFGWQGMGQWFLSGIGTLDTNIALAYLVVTAAFVIAFNLLADILYGVLDPRIRYD